MKDAIRILAAAALLGLAACSGEPVATAPAPEDLPGIAPLPEMGEWTQGHYRERTAMFDKRDVTPGGLAFVGDSITEGGDWAALLPDEQTVNFGIGGDIAEGVLQRLHQVEAAAPDKALLMIGTNDLGHNVDPQVIGDSVEKILDELLTFVDAGDVYVQSVLPRSASYRDRVIELNQRLEHEAYMRGMWFVYLHEEFWDEGWQQLDPALTDDGLHLNAQGYAIWADFLQPYLDGFPVVEGTDIVIPSHYPPGGKVQYNRRASAFATRAVEPGQVAFVGDSITEGGDWEALLPAIDSVNFGIGWDQTSGLLNRIGQIRAAEPSQIVLLIGTNDIGNGQPVTVAAENTRAAIREFRSFVPAEDILVQSVLPREPQNHAAVLELNARLEHIAAEEGVGWLDIYEPFLDGDRLDPTVTEDSLHLTEEGYRRWAAILEPVLAD